MHRCRAGGSCPWTTQLTLKTLGIRNVDPSAGLLEAHGVAQPYMSHRACTCLAWCLCSPGYSPWRRCAPRTASLLPAAPWVTAVGQLVLTGVCKTLPSLLERSALCYEPRAMSGNGVWWGESKRDVPWGGSGLQKDVCSPCKAQRCWCFASSQSHGELERVKCSPHERQECLFTFHGLFWRKWPQGPSWAV